MATKKRRLVIWLAVGPDHDDYTAIKSKTLKSAIRKFKKGTPLERWTDTQIKEHITFHQIGLI